MLADLGGVAIAVRLTDTWHCVPISGPISLLRCPLNCDRYILSQVARKLPPDLSFQPARLETIPLENQTTFPRKPNRS